MSDTYEDGWKNGFEAATVKPAASFLLDERLRRIEDKLDRLLKMYGWSAQLAADADRRRHGGDRD